MLATSAQLRRTKITRLREIADAVTRRDPTGTLVVRSRFRRDLDRRWVRLRQLTTSVISEHDILGLGAPTALGILQAASRPHHPQLPHGDKTEGFQLWMREALRQVVLENDGAWTRAYVRQAAALGNKRGDELTGQKTILSPSRLQTLESVTIAELRGITEAVAQQTTRCVAHCILASERPERIARRVVEILRKVGKLRSDAMAEYMIVKTHGAATLDAFRSVGVKRVGTVAEKIRVARGPHGKHQVQDAGDFDEEKHPRDEHGRFGAGGGGESNKVDNEFLRAVAAYQKIAGTPEGMKKVEGEYGLSRFKENVAADKVDEVYEKTMTASRDREFTKEEQRALKSYQGSGVAERMNRSLRSGKELSEKEQKISGHLDKMIESSSLKENFLLYRGLTGKQAAGMLGAIRPGDTFTDKGFMSTSLDVSTAAGFSQGRSDQSELHVMQILAPKGTNALLAPERESQVSQKEYEAILPRATTLRFVGKSESELGGSKITNYNFMIHGKGVTKDALVLDADDDEDAPTPAEIAEAERAEQKLEALGEVDVLTAGDDDVCEECQDISDEGPYDIDEAEALIPAHPWCRCAFVPVADERFAPVGDALVLDEFNPDQARDPSGKWEAGGGAGAKAEEEKLLTGKLKGSSAERVAMRALLKKTSDPDKRKLLQKRVVDSFYVAHQGALKIGNETKAAELKGKLQSYAYKYGVTNPMAPPATIAEANKGYSPKEIAGAQAAMAAAPPVATTISKEPEKNYSPAETEAFNSLAQIAGQGKAKLYAQHARNALKRDPGLAARTSPGELAHVVAYSGAEYAATNGALRAGVMNEERWNHVNALNGALEKMPAHQGEVYRKASMGPTAAQLYQPGMIVEERGFTSAARSTGVWHGDYHFVITSKTGRDISNVSLHPGEKEVLFRSGTRFKVTSRQGFRIYMEEVSGR